MEVIGDGGHRAVLDEAGADAVRAFVLLAPDGAVPEPGAVEEPIVAGRTASIDDDPAQVSHHDRAADPADGEKQAVDAPLRRR